MVTPMRRMRCSTSRHPSPTTTPSARTGRCGPSLRPSRRSGRSPRFTKRGRPSAPPTSKSSRGRPTATCLSCAPTTASATGSTAIEFHPAWHELMALAIGQETHALCWNEPASRRASRARRAVLSVEPRRERHLLPDRHDLLGHPDPAPRSGPLGRVGQSHHLDRYDGRPGPAPPTRPARTVGMAMTEKQGGSDLRQTQTTARPQRRTAPWSARRAQMVLLRAALGRVPDARADRRGRVLLRRRRLAAGRLAQPAPNPAAQGQVRQQVQRLAPKSSSAARSPSARRAGPRHPHRASR